MVYIRHFRKDSHANDLEMQRIIEWEIINLSECHKENPIVPFLGKRISFVNPEGEELQIPLVIKYEEAWSLNNLNKKAIDDVSKMY